MYQIQPLGKAHRKKDFSCGIDALDHYLIHRAGQDQRRCIAVTYVLVKNQSQEIIGYYTLSATSIQFHDLPDKISKKLPRYPLVPATLVGRLAVDIKYQDHRLGELLLIDALARSLHMSHKIAAFAVIVDAKDENAVRFYKKYGFIQLTDDKKRLFLPMATIRQATQ
jgi:predicted GNAT family N-acyltransferase